MSNLLIFFIMCTFHYGGQSYETLDYSVMSSTPRRSYTEGTKSFNSRAEQEMRELEPEDYKHPFINVYSESGYVYHTGEPKKALRLSLVGQDYIYSPSVKKMTFSSEWLFTTVPAAHTGSYGSWDVSFLKSVQSF